MARRSMGAARTAGAVTLGAALMVAAAACSAGSPKAAPTGPQPLVAGTAVATRVTKYPIAGVTLYQLFYPTQGVRVEAYLTVPQSRRPVPLLVQLHGGFVSEEAIQHYNFGYTAAMAARLASASYAILYPEYQGYLQSAGQVRGLYTTALDTLAGIRAVEALVPIDPQRLYLVGYSLGGGVALKVASLLPHVRAVVAVSPYVGLRTVLPWQAANAQPGTRFFNQRVGETRSYGTLPSQAVLAKESPDVSTITAPVLFLQGTGDHHVAWQTVQQFFTEMKAAGKVVKLVLYPGGHHGLHHDYASAAYVELVTWLQKYGLTFSS